MSLFQIEWGRAERYCYSVHDGYYGYTTTIGMAGNPVGTGVEEGNAVPPLNALAYLTALQ